MKVINHSSYQDVPSKKISMNRLTNIPRFFILAAFVGGATAQAQDNIVLKNGTEIKAKVLEVSSTQLKYHRQDNPDGPIYTTGTADVLLINYANGTKDVLGQAGTGPVLPTGTINSSGSMAVQPTPGIDRLYYRSGWFSREFTDGAGNHVTNRRVQSLLYTQPDALSSFDRGRSLRRLSVVGTVGTVALLGTGAALAMAGNFGNGHRDHNNRDGNMNNDPNDNDPNRMDNRREGHNGDRAVVGYALAGGGVLLGLATVWLDHRATVQFRRAAEGYNTRPTTSLRVGPSSRGLGVGVALRF